MATFVINRHPVTIAAIDLTIPDNFANNLLILKVDCVTLILGRALKKSDKRIKCDSKINQVFFIFNTKELSINRKDLHASTLVGLTRENPLLFPLAVLFLCQNLQSAIGLVLPAERGRKSLHGFHTKSITHP